MHLRLDLFLEALPILGNGMLGIFLVTGVIIAAVKALNWLFREK